MGADEADTGKTSMSKVPYVFVIARNSTGACKGEPAKIPKIAGKLAVRGSTKEVGKR